MTIQNVMFSILILIGATACSHSEQQSNRNSAPTDMQEYVEVLYFHGKQRCITCNAIERLTKETIEKEFAGALKDGKIVLKVIDISTQEGEKIADKYEVTWSSLFINMWKEGKETSYNMTDFGFSYAKGSPEVFKAGMKKKIDELLK